MASTPVRIVNGIGIAALVVVILAVAAEAAWVAQRDHSQTIRQAESLTGGSVQAGKEKVRYIGCAACHTIPQIERASATVGPSLEKFAMRSYIAGVRANSPENLLQWLKDPPSIEPGTAMPNLNLNDDDARDIAAFLYTLK